MRRGTEPKFILNGQGEAIGINLSADFVSEHEWGIKPIQQAFGLDQNAIGVDRHTATEFPFDRLVYRTGKFRGKAMALLVWETNKTCVEYMADKTMQEIAQMCELCVPEDEGVAAAWDERSFGILVIGDGFVKLLDQLHQAFTEHDLAIGIANRKTFENGGLLIRRRSAIPQEEADAMREADLDRIKLLKAAENTGIKELLSKAGKKWFALSPRWTFDRLKDKTEYPVIFWLNPMDQKNDNFGYFTVEELKAWAENKGPIPKK